MRARGFRPEIGPAGRPNGGRAGHRVVLCEFEFEPRPLQAKAGLVRFLLMNRGTVEHDFTILALQRHGGHEKHLLKPGETPQDRGEAAGSYEAICTVPGHKEAGMVVTLAVSE